MPNMILIWLILTIVFIVVEMITVGLTSIWFAAGSLLSLIAAALGAPFGVQLAIFFIVSVILLLATRTWVKKYFNSNIQKTNADRLIGQRTIITETVSNYDQTGKTVIQGLEWTVRAEDDKEIIEKGSMVEVIRISGVKLIVKSVKEEKTCSQQE